MADNFNARLYARAYAPSARANVPSTTGKSAKADSCAPACANCGLLECLCRPRFFAGQLLTEQDLNRLDAYIRAKNRLHTLQLSGWGVVNGLQVRCDPCGTGVIVGTGYGIDPCGEDIIVCSETSVDICSLIKQCRTTDVTCKPTQPGSTGCDDLVEDWVLAIRYSETPTRGITALRMGSTCSCGGTGSTCSSGSGCGCGGATAKTTTTAPTNAMTSTTTQKARGASPECEPTAVCESYAFDVFLAPVEPTRDQPRQLQGALVDSFLCCLQPLIAGFPKPPTTQGPPTNADFNAAKDAWNLWCCRARQALIDYFSTGPQSDCTNLDTASMLVCPSKTSTNFGNSMSQAYDRIQTLLVDAVVACLCAALLPPASAGTSDDRVPLALVSVRKKDCKVMSVCNWTSLRKMVLTFPTLEYWFSWVPWLQSLNDIIGKLCCAKEVETARTFTIDDETHAIDPVETGGSTSTALNPALDSQTVADNQTLTSLLQSAFARGDGTIHQAQLLSGLFGLKAAQPLTANERANIAPFLLINELLRPIALSLPTAEMAKQTPMEVADSVTSGGETNASLYERIRKLEADVEELKNHP